MEFKTFLEEFIAEVKAKPYHISINEEHNSPIDKIMKINGDNEIYIRMVYDGHNGKGTGGYYPIFNILLYSVDSEEETIEEITEDTSRGIRFSLGSFAKLAEIIKMVESYGQREYPLDFIIEMLYQDTHTSVTFPFYTNDELTLTTYSGNDDCFDQIEMDLETIKDILNKVIVLTDIDVYLDEIPERV
jgi:hypothetical protein